MSSRQANFRLYIGVLTLALLLVGAAGCGDDDDPVGPGRSFTAAYFPMAPGDIWYYTDADSTDIVRTIAGDTVILGDTCLLVRHNGTTAEAWSIDETGFSVHLISDSIWADPPLLIPFSLPSTGTYDFDNSLYFVNNDTTYAIDIEGTISFVGYVSKTVPAGTFADVVQLHYAPDDYDEFYAPGVGLLDNGDILLDSAYVGGVLYRP